MPDGLLNLGGTGNIGASNHYLSRRSRDICSTDGAFSGKNKFLFFTGPLLLDGRDYIWYDISRPLDEHSIPYSNIFLLYLVLIMQGGPGDGHPSHLYRLHDGYRCQGTGSSHLNDDLFYLGRRLLGWELTSAAVAAALTTLTLGFVSTAGTGGSAVTEQHADDAKTTTILGALVTDVETPGTDAGRFMGFQWEQLGPVGHLFTPEMRPFAGLTDGFALSWRTATGATVSGHICWEEL